MRDAEVVVKSIKELTKSVETLNETLRKGLDEVAQQIAELKVSLEMKG